jgi:DNA mismatch repair ATPase MutS
MKRIIVDITPKSMLLLNESFASTTEKEGSVIAEDITKALYEEGIRVFMVTHLYEFVKKTYEQMVGQVVFLCAERKEDGTRTFRLLEEEPVYTSYGMDLYDEIIGGNEKLVGVIEDIC